MQVVFLCGGISRRLSPITEDKTLLKFLGKPLVQHHIEQAIGVGLTDLVVIANQGNIQKLEETRQGFPDARIRLAIQEEPEGMGHALLSARELIDKECLVVGGCDVFRPSAYSYLLSEYKKGAASFYFTGYRVEEYFPGGYLIANESGQLQQIVEKPGRGREPSHLLNLVVHGFRDTQLLFRYLEQVGGDGDDAYERAIDQMIKDGYKGQVVPYDDFWGPIKYPWHILTVAEDFLNRLQRRIAPSAVVSPRATIEGEVVIEENVQVLENAVVRGPAYIGTGTVIGNNALIRDHSHIGARCVVGFATEIKHSYIGDGCWFHSNYIGDSIIGDGCSFGAGTVTANLRFDGQRIRVRADKETIDTGLDKLGAMVGQDCKTGVNVSIMPGVRIGPHTTVGPHINVARDVGPNQLIWHKPEYRVVSTRSRLEKGG